MANTSVLFQPIKVGGTWLKNRIIMPSMATNFSSKDGSFTRKHYGYYVERARGGVGLIITEAMPVRFPYGANQDRFGSIIDGKQNQEWYEVNESIHSFGAKIIAQIYDAGFLAFSGKGPEAQALCPIEYAGAKAVSKEEIVQLKAAFVNAAKNAVMAGFDGVELCVAAYNRDLFSFTLPICTSSMNSSLPLQTSVLTNMAAVLKTASVCWVSLSAR